MDEISGLESLGYYHFRSDIVANHAQLEGDVSHHGHLPWNPSHPLLLSRTDMGTNPLGQD
jgi:hypothetical protein